MKINKFLVSVAAAVIALTVAGCGSGATSAESSTGMSTVNEETVTASTEGYTTEEEGLTTASEATTDPLQLHQYGENPVSDYVGAYTDENGNSCSLLIQATDDENDVYITIGYTKGEEYYIWEMFGQIEENVVTYKDAACYKMSPDANSDTGISEEVIYEDGTGTIEISEDRKITWKDDKENAGEGLVFAWDEELNKRLEEAAATGQN